MDETRATDIYWYKLDFKGNVELYSNTPDLTSALEHVLSEAERRGLLVRRNPGIGSMGTFCGRLLIGLLGGIAGLFQMDRWRRR